MKPFTKLLTIVVITLSTNQLSQADSFDRYKVEHQIQQAIHDSHLPGSYPKGVSVEEMLRCQTKASLMAGAADARDRGFPAETYIQSQLQTRMKGADEDNVKLLRAIVDVAYTTYKGDSPEQLRYSFNKWCMSKIQTRN